MADNSATDIHYILDQLDNLGWSDNEAAPDFIQELKDCAWNILRDNPGIDRSEWIDTLIRQYPCEVVDAYGTNPPEVYHQLSDLWETEYTDPDTGDWNTFAGWTDYFANDPDSLRDQLARANERIKELETEIALLRHKTS